MYHSKRIPKPIWSGEKARSVKIFTGSTNFEDVFRKFLTTEHEKTCIGFRHILRKEIHVENGKTVVKKALENSVTTLNRKQLNDRIENAMKGFLKHGMKPKSNVVIFMESRIEWSIASHAILRLGATLATIYSTLGDDGIIHGLNEVEATYCITSSELLPKLVKLASQFQFLKNIIFVEDIVAGTYEKCNVHTIDGINMIPFKNLEHDGSNEATSQVYPIAPNDLALIMYTSGSTGVPKGVMLSHHNIYSLMHNLFCSDLKINPGDKGVSYLPSAHIFEFSAQNMMIVKAATLVFGSPFTLFDSSPGLAAGSKGDLDVTKPDIMSAVPLVIDRLRKGLDEKLKSVGKLGESVVKGSMGIRKWLSFYNLPTFWLDHTTLRKVKGITGGNVKCLVTGGASLSPANHEWAKNFISGYIINGYGSTETGCTGCFSRGNDPTNGRVGRPMPGTHVRLVDWEEGGYRVSDQPHPRGEIWIGGDSISLGYFKREEETKDSFYVDSNGMRWWKSGDIGEVDGTGSFAIIDRKKDLIKMAHGEYVSLGQVESYLKACACVDNICVYGDPSETNMVAVVQPNVAYITKMAIRMGMPESTPMIEICQNKKITQEALDMMATTGAAAKLLKREIPTKITLCPEEWTPNSGLVTAALKIKRKNIYEFYQQSIEKMIEKKMPISDPNNN